MKTREFDSLSCGSENAGFFALLEMTEMLTAVHSYMA